eukprot:XP_014057405.1 PREDICTED: uncharacterized protein LOC106605928 isoform X1 [Salmo salar]
MTASCYGRVESLLVQFGSGLIFGLKKTSTDQHPNMSGAIHLICLALFGWPVSGASVEAQKTSQVCYLCNHDNCPAVEYVYDHLTDLTLWSRGKMADLPPCPTTSPAQSGKCLLCVENQKVYAVCESEIIKPVFEGQGNSMPIIKANCPSIVSTDQTVCLSSPGGAGGLARHPDPNVPTLTPDGTGELSKEAKIAIGVPATIALLVILVIIIIVALRRRTRSRFCLVSTSEVQSGTPDPVKVIKDQCSYCVSLGKEEEMDLQGGC